MAMIKRSKIVLLLQAKKNSIYYIKIVTEISNIGYSNLEFQSYLLLQVKKNLYFI